MRLVLGVIGHVDHGKTALVRALTGMETDRLAEEKRRGISIALGFAHLAVPGGVVDFIDMPGHERFVRTMVSGATGMDAALLVVAANEGVMPQTREHLDIAALLGIGKILVAVTKADLSPAAASIAESASMLVRQLGMQVAGTVLTSSQTGEGLAALRAALAALLPEAAPAAGDGFFYLPADRAFTIQGHGTVVTGTLRRGALAVTDEAVLLPAGRPVRLRGLQVHGARVSRALPGQRVAANLRDLDPDQVPRGSALAPPGLLAPSRWLSVAVTALASAPPLADGARLTLLAATLETQTRLRLLDRAELRPGDTALAQLHTALPVCLPAREHFILRRSSPPQTLAGGRILDALAPRLRRRGGGEASPGLGALAALAACTPAEIVRREIAAAGPRGAETLRLARLAGLSQAQAIAAAESCALVIGGHIAVSREAFASLGRSVCAHLGTAHAGLDRPRLAALLPGTAMAVLEASLAELVREGALSSGPGGLLRLHDPEQERHRAAQEGEAARTLAETLRKAGLSPPDPASLMPAPLARRLTERLVRDGQVIRTFDVVQKREIIFHRDAIETAKRLLAPHLAAAPGLRVGEAGAVIGISRKYAVPLLEHLDAIHFTRRTGDRRRLATGFTAAR